MKKIQIIIFLLSFVVSGQAQGIHFFQGTWSETIKKAASENKLIFIDFYTQWCGPCYNMAKDVFTKSEVGQYYNQHFINVKIDAENGEGIELAKRYKVRSYPTYAYIDPQTEEIVHRSSSRQSAEQFIYTAQSAQTPHLRSFYLDEEYQKGNRDRNLLINYITYKASVYARQEVQVAFKELLEQSSLKEKQIWELYVSSISGLNPYTQMISEDYQDFCNRLGKNEVDKKLKNDTQYGDLKLIESLCDFEGKAFNCAMIRVTNLLNEEKYDEVALKIDSLIADPHTNQQDLIERLKFIARVSYRADSYPNDWFLKCIEYLQYVAYNQKNRDDAAIHQEYAAALEILISKMAKGECSAPNTIVGQPLFGKSTYDMRPDDLKRKPTAKTKSKKK